MAAAADLRKQVAQFDVVKPGLMRTESAALNALPTVTVPQAKNASKTWLWPHAKEVVVLVAVAAAAAAAGVDRAQSVAVKTGVQRTVTAALHAPLMRTANLARPASKT